jgi:hypothetical protein
LILWLFFFCTQNSSLALSWLTNLTNILASRSATEARENRIQGERKKDVQFTRPEKGHGGKPKTISQKARPKGAHCPSMTPLTINSPLKLTVLQLMPWPNMTWEAGSGL